MQCVQINFAIKSSVLIEIYKHIIELENVIFY